jgi:hypothetical protein
MLLGIEKIGAFQVAVAVCVLGIYAGHIGFKRKICIGEIVCLGRNLAVELRKTTRNGRDHQVAGFETDLGVGGV